MTELAALQDLVSNALEVIEIKLIRAREDIDDDSIIFNPTYAHQVFGENENIFGYKDLKVRLYYMAGSLNMYLGLKYTYRIDDFNQDGLKADDVAKEVSNLLTSGSYYTNIDEFLSRLPKEDTFLPMGKKVDAMIINVPGGKARTFEFYECDFATPNFIPFHTKLQTFVMWFVDAGSYIDPDDPQWNFIICFEKYTNSEGKTKYATIGYTSVYLYYAYPENIRPRLSQLLVLQPYQKMGIGSKLIKVVYNKFKSDPKVKDITIEDPSEDFRRIRNFVDASLCKDLASFSPQNLKNGLSQDMINDARINFKINPKQCRIIYEILRLHNTNKNNDKEYKAYRLEVKKRINMAYYKQKRDLKKMEKASNYSNITQAMLPTVEERLDQLVEEYAEIEEDYNRVLKKL